jgi:hypothetical protein
VALEPPQRASIGKSRAEGQRRQRCDDDHDDDEGGHVDDLLGAIGVEIRRLASDVF